MMCFAINSVSSVLTELHAEGGKDSAIVQYHALLKPGYSERFQRLISSVRVSFKSSSVIRCDNSKQSLYFCSYLFLWSKKSYLLVTSKAPIGPRNQ